MTRRPPRAVTPMANETGIPEIMVSTKRALIVWSTIAVAAS
jgi:hypothetical protein